MMLLSRMERDLLDFLCCCAAKSIAVPRIDESRMDQLARLRLAQLVRADSFEPFPWALEAWRTRQTNETAVPKHAAAAEPPSPAAVRSGDAVLCSDAGNQHAAGIVEAASPCFRDEDIHELPGAAISDQIAAEPASDMLPRSAPAHISGAELAAEIVRFCEERNVAPTHFSRLIGSSSSILGDLKRTRRPSERVIKKIRDAIANPPAEIFTAQKQRKPRRWRKDQPERFDLNDSDEAERIRIANAHRNDHVRRSAHATAMKRIEAGAPAGKAGSVQVKLAQIAIEDRLREKARLADPIERAKNILRRRYTPVVSAETINGPAGKFLVGRKLVSERGLLAMAESMAA